MMSGQRDDGKLVEKFFLTFDTWHRFNQRCEIFLLI